MNDLTVHQTAHPHKNAWADAESFALAQRMATALSAAAIFPAKFKDAGSCVVIINMAWRLNMDPMEVAQNIDIIHGNPSWKSAYVISKITSSPQWEEFDFEHTIEGKIKNPTTGEMMDNKVCRVVAKRARDGVVKYGNPVSFKMAIAEGWWTRKDSKWPNMPDQMIEYRAASFFNRIHPTAELLGLRSSDEAADSTEDNTSAQVLTDTKQPRKPSTAPATAPTHVVTITEAVVLPAETPEEFAAAMEAAKALAEGDVAYLDDLKACATVADIDAVNAKYEF